MRGDSDFESVLFFDTDLERERWRDLERDLTREGEWLLDRRLRFLRILSCLSRSRRCRSNASNGSSTTGLKFTNDDKTDKLIRWRIEKTIHTDHCMDLYGEDADDGGWGQIYNLRLKKKEETLNRAVTNRF